MMAPAGPGASLDPPDVLGAVSFPAACSLIGKVAADHSHKWVFKEPQEHEMNLISSWTNPADSVSTTKFDLTVITSGRQAKHHRAMATNL